MKLSSALLDRPENLMDVLTGSEKFKKLRETMQKEPEEAGGAVGPLRTPSTLSTHTSGLPVHGLGSILE